VRRLPTNHGPGGYLARRPVGAQPADRWTTTHEPPSAVLRDHQAVRHQQGESAPGRHPAYLVLRHELALGRQLRTGLADTTLDLSAQVIGDLSIHGPITARIDAYGHHASPGGIHKSSLP